MLERDKQTTSSRWCVVRTQIMPAIKKSLPVERGISVFCYEHTKEGWYVRQWNKAERRYRIKRIDGATTETKALANFYKALATFEETTQRVLRKVSDSATIAELVEEFKRIEEERVAAGLKDERARIRRTSSLNRMLEFLAAKEILYPTQIDAMTWEDYPVFRKAVMKNTRKTELKDIGTFCRLFLVPRGYLTNEIALTRGFIPRITIGDDELDANPAITPNDYKVINTYLRTGFCQKATTYQGEYTRKMFATFVHLLKNSGCRPSELLAVRRKDIEITNPKRWSESKQKWEDDYKLKIHIRKSKTGKKRDVLCRSNAASNLLQFLKYQRGWLNENNFTFTIKDESLVFGNPKEHFDKTLCYRRFDEYWDEVRKSINNQLEGNRFSERKYTLYSLRSTFIEDCITAGLDVYLVARLCGNSVDVIQKHYDRHDVLKRAEEVQSLPFGRTKPPEVEMIDVMSI